MKRSKILASVLLIALAVSGVCIARRFFGPHGLLTDERGLRERSRGNPGAPVWVVEYIDYQCGACLKAYFDIGDFFFTYPSKIYLQARSYPLDAHKHGLKSALYAECAARQNKFWKLHEALFEHQAEWSKLEDPSVPFHEYAKSAGMDLKRLDACVEDPKVKEKIVADKTAASALGISSTPTFFINGKMVVGVPLLHEAMDAALNSKVTKKK